MATICCAMRQLGFTRKRLHRLALQCDVDRANQFYTHIMLHYAPEQLLLLDETSQDLRMMNRSYGSRCAASSRAASGACSCAESASRRSPPSTCTASRTGTPSPAPSMARTSSTAWRWYARVLTRPCLAIIDLASSHKRIDFVQAVLARNAIIEWLPPYCWHLNPIETGFGAVRQWMMKNKHYAQTVAQTRGTKAALNEAFNSVTGPMARSCYLTIP